MLFGYVKHKSPTLWNVKLQMGYAQHDNVCYLVLFCNLIFLETFHIIVIGIVLQIKHSTRWLCYINLWLNYLFMHSYFTLLNQIKWHLDTIILQPNTYHVSFWVLPLSLGSMETFFIIHCEFDWFIILLWLISL